MIDLGDIYGFNLIPHSFDVESFTNCGWDFLAVILPESDGAIFCGTNSGRKRREVDETDGVQRVKPATSRTEIATDRFDITTSGMPEYFVAGGSAIVYFESDSMITRAGFEIEIQIVEPPTTTAAPIDCPNSAWEPNSANTACTPIDLTVQ